LVPKLLKVGHANQLSVFITSSTRQSVSVDFDLRVGEELIRNEIIVKPGETRNVTLTLTKDFPVGAGELFVRGEGGEVKFEEKHHLIIYDNRHVLLVQTSSSTYRTKDEMSIRVIVTDEHFLPLETEELLVEIYDAALKLVGRFARVAVRSGLSDVGDDDIVNRNLFVDHSRCTTIIVIQSSVERRSSYIEFVVERRTSSDRRLSRLQLRSCVSIRD